MTGEQEDRGTGAAYRAVAAAAGQRKRGELHGFSLDREIKPPQFIGYLVPGTDEWLAARARLVGVSEIAAVIGLSPFESRFSLWHRKMGTVGPKVQDAPMEWGNRLEPAVAAKFVEQHPEYAARVSGTYVSAERDWQTAAPDLLLAQSCGCEGDICDGCTTVALLEVKTSIYGDGWGDAGTDEIPVYYRCQVLWYLDALGLSKAHVAVLISGYDYREYVIDLDQQARDDIAVLRTAGQEFVATLLNNARPDIDAHDETLKVIREQHPDIEPTDVAIDSELGDWYLTEHLKEKDAKAAKQHAASLILDALGKARNAVVGVGDLSERIAYRKANGDHAPFLCPDPKAVKARTSTPTIQQTKKAS